MMIMATIAPDGNPFGDPVDPESLQRASEQSTLIVGRTASLTLATDSLIVLGRWLRPMEDCTS